jgi:hypothetical protein
MDEKLKKFNVFLSKRYIYMRNIEHIRFVQVFWYIDSSTNFQSITGISPTAYSFPQLTAALTKRSSAFPTAAFSQQLFHSLQLTAAFPKPTAQPNTPSVLLVM